MPLESDVLDAITHAFAKTPKPRHFTNFTHCEECAEHDETLLDYAPDTITLDQLGNPGWDPICYVDTQGFHYYMPALARLALGRGTDFYLGQFLFHLSPDRIKAFDLKQREAVLAFLEYVRDNMREEVEANCETRVLERRIRRIRGHNHRPKLTSRARDEQ
jgi:hypothetical protein